MASDYNTRAREAIVAPACVGLVSRLYGKGGELVIKLRDNFPDKAELLWVEIDSIATPLFVSSFATQGASKAVVVFEDFRSEPLASLLLGLKLYSEQAIEQDADTDDGLGFLVGFEFRDRTSGLMGRVVDVFESEFNPLIEVDLSDSRMGVLVPLAEDLIHKVDARRGVITMELVEGFFNEDDALDSDDSI